MGVFTHESEHNSAIAPARLFKAFVLNGDTLIQKVAPQAIKCTETMGMDGGTIKKMTFTEGGQCTYIIDNIDKASLSYRHTLTEFEGTTLADKIEKIETQTKILEGSDGGCTIKSVSKYYVVGDVAIVKEHVEGGKEKGMGLFKLVEEYLKENPDSYK